MGAPSRLIPDLVREYHRRGHEITGHSYAEDISSYDFKTTRNRNGTISERRSTLLRRVTGERPVGWLSPRATPSINTLRLVAEEGLLWSGDYPDDELPQVHEIGWETRRHAALFISAGE